MINSARAELIRRDLRMRSVFDALLIALQPRIVCDIGSYNGDEAARFRRILPEAHIFAFEGSIDNVERFMRPREDLQYVNIENVAVSDRDGEEVFHILEANPEGVDWRRMANSLNVRTDELPSREVRVRSVSLDSYFAAEIEAQDTFALWIDVEGALDKVLKGAEKVLSRAVVVKAEVERAEFWKQQKLVDEIVDLMEAGGFILIGDTFVEGASAQSDALFLRRDWLNSL
ncbi:FkbM family methyltransferase [Brevundimonas diminuta]|uniref:FkbM family methyltransferase n=1 Tax=Brevundimonas diminuta TaxID=293 RepID=UPI0020981B23|nr:FkbM family methyltransferase [Brevundimonas diminuta]MCO8031127.1 FkbM family methyltransferase [Brevundimonas diminuta]